MKKLVTSLFALLLLVGVGNAKVASTQYERALINAAKEGNASQVRGLLEAGTDPNVTDDKGNTPLIYAAKENLAAVDMLLFAGADVNARGENGLTPLINATYYGETDVDAIIMRILKEKPDVNAVHWWIGKARAGTTALTNIAMSNNANMTRKAEIVKTLLAQGADVNLYLGGNLMPLREAVQSKHLESVEVVDLLLKAGADPYRPGSDRNTPLDLAKDKARRKLVEQALAAGKEQRDKDLNLIKAVEKGKKEQVRQFLKEGANPNTYLSAHLVNMKDPLGSKSFNTTPLMLARDTEIAQILLSAGADVNAIDAHSYTALHWTLNTPEGLERAKWLIKNGANINALNSSGRTPLLHSLRRQWWDKAQLLLSAGANVTIRDTEGHSAVFYAAKYENEALVKELAKRGARLASQEKQELTDYFAEQTAKGNNSIGNILLKGLANAANDTANFAINNAGKF